MSQLDRSTEDLLRALAPQVLGVLVRRTNQFDACEDAVQDALLAAANQWPTEGAPTNPRAWLITVASRRLQDQWRSERARRERERGVAIALPEEELSVPPLDSDRPQDKDDTLTLLFLCCHPSLTPASQIAMTLRVVGGLTTAQIAAAFLTPEATMGQRISRAKATIKKAGGTFSLPDAHEREDRLKAVLHVLYLIFNEGYVTSSGPNLQTPALIKEAIRLTRGLHGFLPDNGEVAGLLALMILTEARAEARVDRDGGLVPLEEQDRSLWNQTAIEEGSILIEQTLKSGPIGPYQLQAAIAAVHDEAASTEETDWPQILALYGLLERIAPNPLVTLNKAVAVAMVEGPGAGLDVISKVEADARLAGHHRLEAVRAFLHEQAGDVILAKAAYLKAAKLAGSVPERRQMMKRADRLE